MKWSDAEAVRHQLEELDMQDIIITKYGYWCGADNAAEMSRMMRPVVPLMTKGWADEMAWEMFERIEEILKETWGDGPVGIRNEAWVVTARRP